MINLYFKRNAWPVLPQYHPKQMLELMNSGKINRVKAILMHLTRCIIDFEMDQKNKCNIWKNLTMGLQAYAFIMKSFFSIHFNFESTPSSLKKNHLVAHEVFLNLLI